MKSIKNTPHFDKLLHFLAGIVITSLSYLIFKIDVWVAFGIGMSIGLIKEMVWDYYTGGKVEWLDWIATITGSMIAAWIIILLS